RHQSHYHSKTYVVPYTTLFRSESQEEREEDLAIQAEAECYELEMLAVPLRRMVEDPKFKAIQHYLLAEGWLDYGCIIFSQYYDTDRKSTRLNSSHVSISYAVIC